MKDSINRILEDGATLVGSVKEELFNGYPDLEEKNRAILDSFQSARRIQEAILPKHDLLSGVFPESFILYRPKDIVSGDFYWFAEYKSKFIAVVADCTGHGVPGALLSMIGHCLLDSIVLMRGITRPKDIIKMIGGGIKKFLKQDNGTLHSMDGMDVVVCTIDKSNNHLEFAGAGRPLYCVNQRQVEIIRGARSGIGNSDSDKAEISNYEMFCAPGTTIYLTSDGYADQYGGEKAKRLSTKRMLDWILTSDAMSMRDQEKTLLRLFGNWMGINEQTDDVLIVGIRMT